MSTPFPADCAARFRLERPLAQGGFGAVYLATQLSLSRAAAVKVLHHEAGLDAAQVERFLAEARMTASLEHPNIVRIYDHGAATGVPWIAYELLSGETLGEAGRMPLADALAAVSQVAAALEAAHERGIVHRDVKPENVMRGPDGHCKLMDFGIGRRGGGALTSAGMVLGTPGFISPEQLHGAEPGPTGDLYALGVTLFALITGRIPFSGLDALELLKKQAQEDPPPASTFAPVPPAVDALLERALAREPALRPRDARAFRAELDALAAALPKRSGPTQVLPRARRAPPATAVMARQATPLATRVRRQLPAATLVAAALAAVGVFALTRRGPAPIPVAVPSPVDLAAQLTRGSKLFDEKRNDEALKVFWSAVEAHPEDAQAHIQLARALNADQRWAEAEAHLRRALADGGPWATARPGTAYPLHLLATALLKQGKHEDAQAALDASVRAEPDAVDVHVIIAHELYVAGRRLMARQHLALLKRGAPRDLHLILTAGFLLQEDGRHKDALPLLRLARQKRRGWRLNNVHLALSVFHTGGDREALEALDDVLREDPGDLEALALIARFHARARRGPQALASVDAFARRAPGGGAEALRLEVLKMLGRFAELPAAIAASVAAIRDSRKADDFALLGMRVGDLGDMPEATRLLERAVALDPKARSSYLVLAHFARLAKDKPRAIEMGMKAVVLPGTSDDDVWLVMESVKKIDDRAERLAKLRVIAAAAPHLPEPCKAIARTLLDLHRPDEARTWVRRAAKLDPASTQVKELELLVELEKSELVSVTKGPSPGPPARPSGAPAAR